MCPRILFSLLPALLCLVTSPAWSGSWVLGGYLDSVDINPLPAARQGVGDSALALGFEADYQPDNWQIGLGLSVLAFDDLDTFSQTVEGSGFFNNGDISNESSDATGIMLYVDAGPRFSVLDDSLELTAKLGLAYLDAERSISNCLDCYEESIDLDAGGYARFTANYPLEWGGIAIGLTEYFGDDLDSSLFIMLRIGK